MEKLNQVNTEQIRALLEITRAVGDAVQALGEVPSGELYARVMARVDIETYERMIQAMISAGLIRRERSHMLVWIGPGRAE